MCPAVARQLPSMRKGEMPLVDSAVLSNMVLPERDPGAACALFFQRFVRLWQRLSPRQRDVVELLHVNGFSTWKASRSLGMSQTMVRSHYRRALRKIGSEEVLKNRNG